MHFTTSILLVVCVAVLSVNAQPNKGRYEGQQRSSVNPVGKPIGYKEPKLGVLFVDMEDGPGAKMMTDMKKDIHVLNLSDSDMQTLGKIAERAIKSKAAELSQGGAGGQRPGQNSYTIRPITQQRPWENRSPARLEVPYKPSIGQWNNNNNNKRF